MLVPEELAYVEVALACNVDPERVLEWDERTWDDVTLVLRARAANQRARLSRRG